jgi:hypothetical protein
VRRLIPLLVLAGPVYLFAFAGRVGGPPPELLARRGRLVCRYPRDEGADGWVGRYPLRHKGKRIVLSALGAPEVLSERGEATGGVESAHAMFALMLNVTMPFALRMPVQTHPLNGRKGRDRPLFLGLSSRFDHTSSCPRRSEQGAESCW